MLYLVEYADYDSQKTIGYGVVNTRYDKDPFISSGELDNLKNKSGYILNDQKHSVAYRGIENLYGNMNQLLDGINSINYSRQYYVSRDRSQYETGKTDGSYVMLGYACPFNSSWIKEVGYDPDFPEIQIMKEEGGSDSTYIPDYSYNNGEIVTFGGTISDGLSSGLWRLGCRLNYDYNDNCTRLLYIPKE